MMIYTLNRLTEVGSSRQFLIAFDDFPQLGTRQTLTIIYSFSLLKNDQLFCIVLILLQVHSLYCLNPYLHTLNIIDDLDNYMPSLDGITTKSEGPTASLSYWRR